MYQEVTLVVLFMCVCVCVCSVENNAFTAKGMVALADALGYNNMLAELQ